MFDMLTTIFIKTQTNKNKTYFHKTGNSCDTYLCGFYYKVRAALFMLKHIEIKCSVMNFACLRLYEYCRQILEK